MYNAIIDCAYRAAEQAGISTVVPAGTAVQNARTTYIGQNMNRDGYHMNFEYGRYLVGLTYAAVVLGVDPQTVTYHPSTISDNLAQLCRDAVTAALAKPKEITSLSDKWGVNPDVVNQPLARKVSISLETEKADEMMGSKWNFINATDPMAVTENLIDDAFVPTAVRVSVNKAFSATEPGSLLLTGLYHGQTYDITLSYLNAGQPATIVQRAIAPDVNGRVYVDAETASAQGDGIDGLYAIEIQPSLQYTAADGQTATLDPTTGIPERIAPGTPWDGTATSEPAMGSGNCYVINAAAELAWVANISNQGITAANMLITQDIDLGGHKWTPIGKAKYYNGSIKGQGHTISGLYLEPTAADAVSGFIGQTNGAGTISDLYLEGKMVVKKLPTAKNADYGSFIGLANALKALSNCHAKVDIEGEGGCGIYQGGLIGRMKATRVEGCSYEGTMTIGATNTKTKGYGALVGTANSGVEGAVGSIENCWMTGTVKNTSSASCTYGAAIIGYANLSKGVLTIKNNYVSGQLLCTGAQPTNYAVVSAKSAGVKTHTILGTNYAVNTLPEDKNATQVSENDVHSGMLCYLLNLDQEKAVFGQNLSVADSHPVLLVEGQNVQRVDFYVDAVQYATTFNNGTLVLPANNPSKEGMQFDGWFDASEGGNAFTAGATIGPNASLYAHFSVPSGIHHAEAEVSLQPLRYYTLDGCVAPTIFRGIVVTEKGKKVIKK